MRTSSTRVLVIAVAGIVAFTGVAFIRLSVRRDQAERRAKAEYLTVQTSDQLEGEFERITQTLQRMAQQISRQGTASLSKALAGAASSDSRHAVAVFVVSKGRVVAGFPSGSDEKQFRAFPFEDWSTDDGNGRVSRSKQPVGEGPLRMPDGGSAIVVRMPLADGKLPRSSSSGDWVVAAVSVQNLVQSAGLDRLPGLGFDYELSCMDVGGRREHRFMASTDAALEEPLERRVRFLQNVWTLAIAARGGWFARRPIFIHIGLVVIFVLLAAIFTNDLASEPERLRLQLEKRENRIKATNRKWMQENEQRADLEKQLGHASFHDALTGLPNRLYFTNRLERALRRVRRQPEYQLAVITLDVDRFKSVNDSLGLAAGDQLLLQAVRRFEGCLRPSDLVVARVGGDELAFLVFDIQSQETAIAVAERLQQALAEPFALEGQNVTVTASMGIAMSSMTHDSADELIRGADIALSKAKAEGRAHYEVFDPAARDQIVSAQQLENDLRRAIEQEELHLHFQPIVSLQTGIIAGMEVLVRWHHPFEGIIAPGRFVPMAEETGSIVPMNRWIIRRACHQARAWREKLPGDIDFYLSVNLSARDLREPDLCDFFASLLHETGLPPGVLRAEVTEGGLIGNVKLASELVSRLRQLGVPLLLDDFGMGYSSLSYLQLFKFDYLKIDMSFVRRITPDGQNLGILRAIIHMAEDLGIQTIAEGIEHEHVREHLLNLGCPYGQGYYFAKPVEAHLAEQFLRERSLPSQGALVPQTTSRKS